MDEALEVLLYLLGFWRFVFSKRFRSEWIAKFKRMNYFQKLMEVIGALITTTVGLGMPALVVYFLFFYFVVEECCHARI